MYSFCSPVQNILFLFLDGNKFLLNLITKIFHPVCAARRPDFRSSLVQEDVQPKFKRYECCYLVLRQGTKTEFYSFAAVGESVSAANMPNHIRELVSATNMPNHIQGLVSATNMPNHIQDLVSATNMPYHIQ